MNQRRTRKTGQKRKKVIFYIPNVWLCDVLSRLLPEDEYEIIIMKEKETSKNADVIVVDIAAYQCNCRKMFSDMHTAYPSASVLALLSESNKTYSDKIMQMGANGIVWKEEADDTFYPVIQKAASGAQLTRRSLRKIHSTLPQEKEGTKVQKKSIFEKPISRRSFLVGSAASALALTAAACAPAVEDESTVEKTTAESTEGTTAESQAPVVEKPEEQIYYGSCRNNCFGGCHLKITVRDGKVVKTAMAEMTDPRYNRICTKGLSHVQRIYAADRLKYPMKRVGERGAGEWKQITWEEATQEIADTWMKLQAEYGDGSIAFTQTSGNFGTIHPGAAPRLKALIGGTTISTPVDATVYYSTGNAFGISEAYSGSEVADCLNSKCIILWGANPADAMLQNWKLYREAQRAGAKLIVVDPNFTTSASKADYFVPIKPGTDSVLAMAMMNIVLEKGWTDDEFLKFRSVAPFLVKESDGKYLRLSEVTGEAPAEGTTDPILVWDESADTYGTADEVTTPALNGAHEINGIKVNTAYDLLIERIKDMTPAYAAEFCDLDEQLIYDITEVYATSGPGWIVNGFGPDHYANGHYAVFATCCLAILTGNAGKSGAACGLFNPLGAFQSGRLTAPENAKTGVTVPNTYMKQVMEEKQLNGTPVDLHSLYVHCGNPLANAAGRADLLEAMLKLDLIVVADYTLNDTAQYADIVLPVAHWFEVNDIHSRVSESPHCMLQEKAIEPLYESKSDLEVIGMIAEKMGLGEHFQKTDLEWIEEELDTDYARMMGITMENLKEKKVLRNISGGDGKNYVHGENGFPTATGRAQFYLENPAPNHALGHQISFEKECLPYWEAPNEAWSENPLAAKYPLVFGQERPKYRVHTQYGTNPWLLELDPEPIVKLNPKDADARGIAMGDMVKVFNDRGYVVLKAVISNGTRPGMIVMPKGWQRGQFVDGHYQDLTSPAHHEACLNGCFYDALVEVEKM